MNAERLHAVVIALNQEMKSADTVGKMQTLISALELVVNQPHASHQEALSQALKSFYAALTDSPSDLFSPTWRQILCEVGGEGLFGRNLRESVVSVFAQNQITPAVAAGELKELHARLQAFKTALGQIAASLQHFKIGHEALAPGECEIGVLIPRSAVNNQLRDFAAELKEIAFILNTISEISTGETDELSIRTISSSDLLVYLQANAPYAACVAVAIERLVALYKQLLEIRKLHLEIRKQGVPDTETMGIEKYANQLMRKGIDELVADVLKKYRKKGETGRKNELANALRISLNKLANRIDKGFSLEVRVEPITFNGDSSEQDKKLSKEIEVIQAATPNMQFLKLEGRPILSLPESKEEPKKKD